MPSTPSSLGSKNVNQHGIQIHTLFDVDLESPLNARKGTLSLQIYLMKFSF